MGLGRGTCQEGCTQRSQDPVPKKWGCRSITTGWLHLPNPPTALSIVYVLQRLKEEGTLPQVIRWRHV